MSITHMDIVVTIVVFQEFYERAFYMTVPIVNARVLVIDYGVWGFFHSFSCLKFGEGFAT